MMVAATGFLLASAGATAAPAAEASGDSILVVGRYEGYGASQSTSATRTDTPLLDTPQSVAVISREQLDDQADRSIADVLRYVPGVTVGQGEGNRDQVVLRGQNSTADFFLDGVRDDVQYYRNLYNIERVEVLKGASALIFGRGGGGGVVNRVQKTPSLTRSAGTISGGANSFGSWTIAADGNLPLSAAAALRVNGFYEDLSSFRDFTGGERYAVNPYLGVELSPDWQAGLSYEYVHDDRVTDRGVPSLACARPCTPGPLPGHRDTFFGVPGANRTGVDAHIVKGRLEGTLAPGLAWSSTLLYGNYDKFYDNVFANGAASAADGTVQLNGYSDATRRENVIAQTNLVADLALGGTTHKLLFGLEYADQSTASRRNNAVLSFDKLGLAAIAYPTVSFSVASRSTRSNVRVFSAYVQDQLSFGDHLDVIAGIRYDRFTIDGVDILGGNTPFARTDEMISPRVGLVLKPQPQVSLYASYSRSFLPRSGDQFVSLSATTQNLAPEAFTNYELGAKWEIAPGLTATAALFQLDRTNATTPDPVNPLQSIDIGQTRTRGAELSLVGRILPGWQVSGGYTRQDGKLRGIDSVTLAQVPEHQFALWNRYDVSRTFGVGLGVVHQSSQYAAIRTSAGTTLVPAFTRVDAALFWKASTAVELQLNVENLLDETYFAAAHNNNNLTPGAPLNARLTAKVKF